ncbi:MAG: InlB B-repeat-containing protein [Clostridia bacterium]|nr:InlB B-repeat-containing protein [Clostridia bacterium]
MMKKITIVSAFLLVLLMISVVFVGCNNNKIVATGSDVGGESSESSEPVEQEDLFKIFAADGIVVLESGNTFTIEVGNETTVLQLHKYVTVAEGIKWMVASDISMQDEIKNKILSLEEGDNLFYVYCYTDDESVMENYVVKIHRQGSYDVTFEGISAKQTVTEGAYAKEPSEKPAKEGYEFAGWDFDFTKPVKSDVTVYAKWTPKSYKITYDAGLGTLEGSKTVTVVYGEEITLAVPQRDGFIFADWYYGEECVKSGVWMITSDVTLSARWANDSYTVTFNPNGGTMNASTVVEVSYGAPIVFPVPVKDGFTFGGWYDGETLCLDGTYDYTKDLNLVAKWNERSSTLTFFENGGSKNSYTETLPFGSTLPIPVRSGFTFGGWFSDIELTKPVTSVPDESMRLYAWWTEEGKPGEFIYEASGMSYKVTARVDKESTSLVPAYIGGRKVLDALPRPNPDAGIVLERDNLTIKIDRFVQIVATFIPEFEGDDMTLTYSSNKPEVANVDKNGMVTAYSAGACVVTICNEATGYEAICIIIVDTTAKNPDAHLTVAPKEELLLPGEELDLTVDFVPEYSDDVTKLIFTSTVPEILTVDDTGKVQALALGEGKIIVTNAYGSLQAVCTFTVVEKKPNQNPGITLDQEALTIYLGENATVNAVFVPTYEGDDTTLIWTSDKPEIATVENGKITAVAVGECVVTVANADASYSKTVAVKVEKKANENAGITTDVEELTLSVGEQGTITATFIPLYDGDDLTLVWSCDKPVIATVENGKITAVAVGECVVTVTNIDASFSKTVAVKVEKKANENAGITTDVNELTLTVGDQETVTATFVPAYEGDDLTLTWSCDSETVASVENGVVTALAEGDCVITVTNTDGTYQATVSVSVTAAAVEPESEHEPEPEPAEEELPA